MYENTNLSKFVFIQKKKAKKFNQIFYIQIIILPCPDDNNINLILPVRNKCEKIGFFFQKQPIPKKQDKWLEQILSYFLIPMYQFHSIINIIIYSNKLINTNAPSSKNSKIRITVSTRSIYRRSSLSEIVCATSSKYVYNQPIKLLRNIDFRLNILQNIIGL